MHSEYDILAIYNYIGDTFNLIFGLICLFTSLLVAYICLARCDRKATEIRLICVFCFIESLLGIIFIVYSLIKLIFGYQITGKGTKMCKFSSFALISFTRISLFNISFLATLRYLIVCHSKELKLYTWFIIFFFTNVGILLFYSLGFYTNDAAPSASHLYCTFFAQKGTISSVALYFIPFLYILPSWLTTYCYFAVGWTANKRLSLMKQEAVNSSDEICLIAIKKQRIKLLIQLLFVFIIYNVNFGLSYVTWAMKLVSNYKRTTIIDAMIVLQINITTFINPAVTIIFQPDINNEFKFLWVKFKLKTYSFFKKLFHR